MPAENNGIKYDYPLQDDNYHDSMQVYLKEGIGNLQSITRSIPCWATLEGLQADGRELKGACSVTLFNVTLYTYKITFKPGNSSLLR